MYCRWEISLHIHERLHTDGTFPNKSRAGRRRFVHNTAAAANKTAGVKTETTSANSKAETKTASVGKTKTKAAKVAAGVSGDSKKMAVSRLTGDATVSRQSYIVAHRRTSSDEDEDEFTFHVHADGPTEVPTHYPPPTKQQKPRAQPGVSVAVCDNNI